jgi:hypothetical protein
MYSLKDVVQREPYALEVTSGVVTFWRGSIASIEQQRSFHTAIILTWSIAICREY